MWRLGSIARLLRSRPSARAQAPDCRAAPRPSCQEGPGRSRPSPAGAADFVGGRDLDRDVAAADPLRQAPAPGRGVIALGAQLRDLLPRAEDDELPEVDPPATELPAQLIERSLHGGRLGDRVAAMLRRHSPSVAPVSHRGWLESTPWVMCASARTWDGCNHDDTAIHDADGDRDPPREARSHASAEAPLISRATRVGREGREVPRACAAGRRRRRSSEAPARQRSRR